MLQAATKLAMESSESKEKKKSEPPTATKVIQDTGDSSGREDRSAVHTTDGKCTLAALDQQIDALLNDGSHTPQARSDNPTSDANVLQGRGASSDYESQGEL